MRRKIITVLSLLIFFTLVFGAQIASTVSAQTKDGHPITSPITFFKISGNVTYKVFRNFAHGFERFMPAANVKITAEDVFTHTKYETTTDVNGNYTISTDGKGFFLVTPSGGDTSTYIPAMRVVPANNAGSKNNVSFHGFVFP